LHQSFHCYQVLAFLTIRAIDDAAIVDLGAKLMTNLVIKFITASGDLIKV